VTPVSEILDRIRWDADYGAAEFTIGYFDRVENRVVLRPIGSVYFEPGDRFFFHFFDEDAEEHSVPLHRIRDVYRNGERIWHRGA
jgi:uncharacterized protein (UPF0248 family)